MGKVKGGGAGVGAGAMRNGTGEGVGVGVEGGGGIATSKGVRGFGGRGGVTRGRGCAGGVATGRGQGGGNPGEGMGMADDPIIRTEAAAINGQGGGGGE